MTTTFRTAGAWGAGKGSDLTPAEVDTNFYDKETRITAIEAAGVAVGIDSITVSGDQMTVHMTDASIQGPFTLPSVSWTPRGAWQAGGSYLALDVVTYGGTAYLVTADHTAATSFDPNETTSTATLLYEPIWSYTPAQGFEVSDATFSPTLLHANSYVRLTNAGGCTVTLDPAEGFDDWTEISFRDASTDTGAFCTFDVATPGSIVGMTGHINQTVGQGSVVTMKKNGSTDVWDLFGHLQVL